MTKKETIDLQIRQQRRIVRIHWSMFTGALAIVCVVVVVSLFSGRLEHVMPMLSQLCIAVMVGGGLSLPAINEQRKLDELELRRARLA
jgi:hypothetical protein